MSARGVRRGALFVALVVLVAPVPAAQAVTGWNAGHTSMGQRCSWALVHISNDAGWPAMWTKATADESMNNWCDDPSFRAPAQALAVKQDLWAWHQPPNGAQGWWWNCNQGPWFVNDQVSHEWNTWFSWPARPCNSHWFYASGFASVHFNGRWHGFGVPVQTGWVGVP